MIVLDLVFSMVYACFAADRRLVADMELQFLEIVLFQLGFLWYVCLECVLVDRRLACDWQRWTNFDMMASVISAYMRSLLVTNTSMSTPKA
jgi:hypothetical protein